jgi:protocatechuate 3,4-dioxygenase alpha subunit
MKLTETASQTVGPFFQIGLSPHYRTELAGPAVPGERVEVEGTILDGDGNPVPDAVLETWQANQRGEYSSGGDFRNAPAQGRFHGFGRIPTDENGHFRFTTIKPGPVPGPGGRAQAPHLTISVFMRGLLLRLVTRMYFPGEEANERDPILSLVHPARRETLIARHDEGSPTLLHLDLHLQGDQETVFFDC